MKLLSWFLLSIALACSGNNSSEEAYKSGNESILELVNNSELDQVSFDFNFEEREQKIIKESFLRFQTNNLEKTYQEIVNYTRQHEGFIQKDESGKGYGDYNRSLVIRIPTQNFQKVIDSISKNVSYFDTKRISARDVTEEFIDLEARLKAKKTLENRYLELLKKANSVKEILEIERELSSIREEIEAKEGRLKYLQNQVSLSTLTIEFYKLTAENGVTVSYGSKMWKALKSGFNGLSFFFLGILNIWPFILIVIFTVFFLRRRFFKKKKL
ncbi:DUF4349 domain-containing protein [Flavobacteriaceae bacterium R38]|nr:DUF4349 domain-containing protein [Flavobacteriaceae bacterium R38]